MFLPNRNFFNFYLKSNKQCFFQCTISGGTLLPALFMVCTSTYNLYPPLWKNKIVLLPDHANNKMGSLKGVFSINGNV